MKHLYTVLFALGTSAVVHTQTNRDDLTPLEISYTTTVSEDLKSLGIEMVIHNVNRPTLHIGIPRWTPGAYGISDYGEGLRDLSVTGTEGSELPVTQMDRNNWSIAAEGHPDIRVSYEISASRRRRWGRRYGAPRGSARAAGPRSRCRRAS